MPLHTTTPLNVPSLVKCIPKIGYHERFRGKYKRCIAESVTSNSLLLSVGALHVKWLTNTSICAYWYLHPYIWAYKSQGVLRAMPQAWLVHESYSFNKLIRSGVRGNFAGSDNKVTVA
jgi:hypothetical protein